MNSDNLKGLLANASARLQHQVERIEAEFYWAEQLCGLHPAQAAAWKPLLTAARAKVANGLAASRLEELGAAVAAAESILAPIGAIAKSYTIHCVGHAHIDMNWMWSWPETVSVTNDTFTTVLRLMDEFREFKFSQSQASTYAIVERHNPELLRRIARRVKEGRWEVTASHWVEADKNMAGGESLCRHLLYTRRYLQELFGLAPEDVPIDWSPDTFGHAATVPTYLAQGGIKYLYLHRPGVHTADKPGAFWWEGPDGARVLVRNDMTLGYNQQIGPALIEHLVAFVKLTGGRNWMSVYGIGDHGGGPTRRDIVRALDMDTWPIFPNVKFSTAVAFYRQLEREGAGLPVLRGELNSEFTGCYTTQTLIKKCNRFAENRLLDVEAACVFARLAAGSAYPHRALTACWRDTLFSHFHDILPGSGVHDTRTYTHGLYQKTMAATSMLELQALRRLAAAIDTSRAGAAESPAAPPSRLASSLGAGVGYRAADGRLTHADQSAGHGPRPFVVFNPTAIDRAETIEATIWDNAPAGAAPLKSRTFAVRLPDGSQRAVQVVNSGNFWAHDYVTVAFPARVPGLGYSQYSVHEVAPGSDLGPVRAGWEWQVVKSDKVAKEAARHIGWKHHCWYSPPERSPEGLENELLRVELDTASGGIKSLIDKRSGLELIAPAGRAPALEYAVERPHGMTAWSIEHTGAVEYPAVTAMRRALEGPYRAALDVDLRIRESSFTLTYEVRAGDPRLYLRIAGTWFQRGTKEEGVPVLALALPLALAEARGRYEIPFGAIDRDLNRGEEVPALQWAQVTGRINGQTAGCLWLNDSKHGHSLNGSTLRLTLIRSSLDPDPLPEIGQHEIHLAVLPFAGELPVAQAMREGLTFNRALRVVSTDIHAGRLPPEGRFLRITSEALLLGGFKAVEKGADLVLRFVNPTARPATAKVEADPRLAGRIAAAQAVDLLERPRGESAGVKLTGGALRVTVPARGLASVRVAIKAGKRQARGSKATAKEGS
jgi:alpha-mannosidase